MGKETMETVTPLFWGLQNHCRWWLQPWNALDMTEWLNWTESSSPKHGYQFSFIVFWSLSEHSQHRIDLPCTGLLKCRHWNHSSHDTRVLVYFKSHQREILTFLVKLNLKAIQSSPTFSDPHGLYNPWNSPGQNTGVGSLSLLRGIFPTQGLNSGLLHCRWILSQLSHKGSSRMLEWVAYPFSSGSSWPENGIGVSCIAGRFFTDWASRWR